MARLIWIGPAPLRAGHFIVGSMQIVEVTKSEQRHLSRHIRSRRLADPRVLSRQIAADKIPVPRVRQLAALAGFDPGQTHEALKEELVEYLTSPGEPTIKAVKVVRTTPPAIAKLHRLVEEEAAAAKPEPEPEPEFSAIDARRSLVWEMCQSGDTLATIADILGVSKSTVSKDLKAYAAQEEE